MLVHGTCDSHPSRYMYCPMASTVDIATVQNNIEGAQIATYKSWIHEEEKKQPICQGGLIREVHFRKMPLDDTCTLAYIHILYTSSLFSLT